MRSETSERHNPEVMLLRVIRAAQILVEGQDKLSDQPPHPDFEDDGSSQLVEPGKSVQKTQT
jgi:hypothetical protein